MDLARPGRLEGGRDDAPGLDELMLLVGEPVLGGGQLVVSAHRMPGPDRRVLQTVRDEDGHLSRRLLEHGQRAALTAAALGRAARPRGPLARGGDLLAVARVLPALVVPVGDVVDSRERSDAGPELGKST